MTTPEAGKAKVEHGEAWWDEVGVESERALGSGEKVSDTDGTWQVVRTWQVAGDVGMTFTLARLDGPVGQDTEYRLRFERHERGAPWGLYRYWPGLASIRSEGSLADAQIMFEPSNAQRIYEEYLDEYLGYQDRGTEEFK